MLVFGKCKDLGGREGGEKQEGCCGAREFLSELSYGYCETTVLCSTGTEEEHP